MAPGESDLSAFAFNRGAQQPANFTVIEDARGCPYLAGDREQFFWA